MFLPDVYGVIAAGSVAGDLGARARPGSSRARRRPVRAGASAPPAGPRRGRSRPRPDVDARRMDARSQRPEVEVVNRLDARYLEDAPPQSRHVDLARVPSRRMCAGLPEQRHGAGQDERRDADGHRGIEPRPPVRESRGRPRRRRRDPTGPSATSMCAAREVQALASRPRASSRIATRLAASPAAATRSMIPVRTATGLRNRPTASNRIQPAMTRSTAR